MSSGQMTADDWAAHVPKTLGHGGGGHMGEAIREFDWSKTPLGPISHWPQSLRTVVNILLSSRYAMWMAWGPELTMLYNDAYRPTLGIKHPWALGTRASEVWSEIWPDIGPRIETVLGTGQATYEEGLLLFLERSGFPEETYHTFSYSPLADDEGRICGMLCVVTEETERLIGERRVETLRDVASALARTNTEDEVLRALKDELSLNKKDLPFTLTYLFDDAGAARLAASSGIRSDASAGAGTDRSGSRFSMAGAADLSSSGAAPDGGSGGTTKRGCHCRQATGTNRRNRLRSCRSGSRGKSSRQDSLSSARIRIDVIVRLTALLSICLPDRFPPRSATREPMKRNGGAQKRSPNSIAPRQRSFRM